MALLAASLAVATRLTAQREANGPATHPTSASAAPTNAPATTQPGAEAAREPATQATTQPATQPASIRLNFHDTPLDTVLERLSQDSGLTIVRQAPVDGLVTVISIQPLTPAQAIVLVDEVLKGKGLTAVQDGNTVRIVARDAAKKGNLPVHFGADPEAVEVSEQLITQVIPVHNVDALKLKQDLTPLIDKDADITANSGANAIVLTDTSSNVRRIVQIISILDKREGVTSEVKIIPLKNASATSAVRMVLDLFHVEEPKAQPNQPPPPPRVKEGRLLGTGVDQALYGGKVTATADVRTNSVVVAAPAETLKVIEGLLKEIDENPATAATPVIKSFHLKIADAASVAKALSAVFESQGGEQRQTQSHQQRTDEPVNARISVVAEERTNTLIVTAPPAALELVQQLVDDVDNHPVVESTVRTFALKFADAASAAKEVLAVYVDPATGLSRLQAGPREKIGVTADERTNSIVVTAPVDAMKLVEQTVRDLDASPADDGGVKFFRLKRGDSDATAKLILAFFKPPDSAADHRPPNSVHVGVNAVSDPRTNTVAVTAPPEAMKVVEQIVQQVESEPSSAFDIESFSLKNADATATAKLLTTLFAPDQGAAAGSAKLDIRDSPVKARVVAVADDRTNSVVVTAPAETLKVIETVMRLLDANPLAGAEIQVFQLQNADAERAGKLLESIIQPPALTMNTTGASPNAPKPPGELDAIRKLGWLTTAADDRTNTLIVTAPSTVMKAAASIIRTLDGNPASQQSFFIYRMRNAKSQNLELVLNELFGNTQVGSSQTQQRTGLSQQSQLGQLAGAQAGQSSFGGTGLASAGGAVSPAGGSGIGARYGTVSAGAAVPPVTPQLSNAMQRVVSELTGQVFVVADPDTNSLLVTTATRYQQEVRDIIAELDRPVRQVLIKILIAEVTHDNSSDLGADFSVLNQRKSGNGESVVQNLGNAVANTTSGGLAVALTEANVTATLHALAAVNKLDVLSRPYILASDNQLASITIGNEVPFITDTRLTETGQTINTIQYQDVGIILNVTPHVNPEGLVILDVAPEISQVGAQTVSISAGVNAPVISKRSAQSRVGIRDGQTVVIGGLMQDQNTTNITKVPILGDLPFIGPAFTRTQTDKTKTELLIFLTPHVAPQPDALEPMTRDELRGVTLTPKAVGPGAFDQHMRNMQRGAAPATQPTTRRLDPVIEFAPAASQPSDPSGPSTTGPITLPE